jgi:DNA-directed RNA polymerase subunit beta'
VIVGRLIPAGTGLAYHSNRRKNASGLTDSELETLSAPVTTEAAPVAEAGEESSAS